MAEGTWGKKALRKHLAEALPTNAKVAGPKGTDHLRGTWTCFSSGVSPTSYLGSDEQ